MMNATSDTHLEDALRDLAGPPARSTDLAARLFLRHTRLHSPVGDVWVAHGSTGIRMLRLADEASFLTDLHHRLGRPSERAADAPAGTQAALDRLDGSGLTYDLSELGAFEQDVLAAAATIPRGEARPYGWIAKEIGRPKAVRAVGSALGRNPVPLLIPCHRVVRSDWTTGDYIFGRSVKAALLAREGFEAPRLPR
jgi:methylated-DNA-[protein]-cysteine S-methyltransferase